MNKTEIENIKTQCLQDVEYNTKLFKLGKITIDEFKFIINSSINLIKLYDDLKIKEQLQNIIKRF